MLVVVYDIAEDRRRTRLHRKLRAVGRSVQFSAFECEDDVLEEVLEVIGEYTRSSDRVRVYQLCSRCEQRLFKIGEPIDSVVDDVDFHVPVAPVASCVVSAPLEQGRMRASSFLMDRICRMSNLREAWKRVRTNRGCAGVDGVGLRRFELELEERLVSLQEALLDGSYTANRLKTVYIAKPTGGSRKLSIPTVTDRVAQQAVLRVVGPILDAEFEDSSYAYRPGRSVRRAIRTIERLRDAGWTYVLDADITDYFGTIDHEQLIEVFRRYVADDEVIRLVRQWVEAADEAPYRQESQLRGVPQGGVLSPLLANLYLDAFDERIEDLGYKLVRYADDFIVLCRTPEQAEQALVDVGVILRGLRLELNEHKTRITSFGEGFQFLGYLLVGRMALKSDRAKMKREGSIRISPRR